MTKKLGFSILVIVLAVLAGWMLFGREATAPAVDVENELGTELTNIASCSPEGFIAEVIEGPFRRLSSSSAGGEARLSGTVMSREEEFFADRINSVYLKISRPSSPAESMAFYDYFAELVSQGNSINAFENSELLFKLGQLESDAGLLSTADISDRAEFRIKDAVASGEAISLILKIPVFAGAGAPSEFSFACSIQTAE